ncbi:DinB family protein [Emticicia sp. C21]|uniref:DinB family protein n=1 Tax=Emticicia sp. C21 TaxID=2302915 RepID=UPI000E34372C|nr:DinB family protein [Emticicia sp. C21]RFS18153.1 DinB family protein [Emticicia sp. C21]
MKKSDINPMPEYFDRYINLADDVDLKEALTISAEELTNLPLERWKAIGDKVYAPGKWTIKDILQHMIDTERIFGYRALCFARGEAARMPSFDEEEYGRNTNANQRTLEALIDELKIVRVSIIALYNSFTDEMLLKTGLSFKGTYSVLAIGFITVGHQRWHLNIINERYEGLI